MFFIQLLYSLSLSSFKKYAIYAISAYPLTLFILFTSFCTFDDTLLMNEWCMGFVGALFNMWIWLPQMFHTNAISIILGSIYFIFSVYYWYGEMGLTVKISLFFTIFYLILGLYSVYAQFKELHKVIFTNEKLANEMKRLLEVFPESVFICSKDLKNQKVTVWTNYQFEQDICKVQ